MAVRTQKVINAEGVEERGVRISAKNYVQVAEWILKYSSEQVPMPIVKVTEGGEESDHRVRFRIPKAGIRVARVGDTVARNAQGFFYVIKASDVKAVVI